MNLTESTIGIQIREVIAQVRDTVESNLIKLSGNTEWFVDVEYTCSLAVSNAGANPVKDCLTVTVASYIDDESQGNHKFSFSSHEAIFLNGICEAIYKIILNPADVNKILFDAKLTIVYLQ